MAAVPEADSTSQFEFRDYLRILWRRSWIILLTTLVVVGAAVFLSSRKTEMFEATATLKGDGNGGDPLATELVVLQSQAVRDIALASQTDLSGISVRQVGRLTSLVMEIKAKDADPARAAATANAYADAYISYKENDRFARSSAKLQELQTRSAAIGVELEKTKEAMRPLQLGLASLVSPTKLPPESDANFNARVAAYQTAKRDLELQLQPLEQRQGSFSSQLLLIENQIRDLTTTVQTNNAAILTKAVESTEPFSPKPLRDALTALALGLLLGLIFAFLVEYLDDSVKTREHVERAIGPDIPIIGQIPAFSVKRPSALVTFAAPTSAAAEAFRSLRTSVQFIGVKRDIRTIAVTSASPGEGKSTVIANLAVVLAGAGKRVVLIDCDLRRPTLHRFFGRAGLDSSVGVTSVIIGEAPLEVALQDVTGIQRLRLLPSGPIPPNPSELLSSKAFIQLLENLADEDTIVLIDAPPVLPVTDAVLISSIVDQMVFVVSAATSSRSKVRQAIDRLARVNARPGGVVINYSEEEVVESYSYVEKKQKRQRRKKDSEAESSLDRFDPSRRLS